MRLLRITCLIACVTLAACSTGSDRCPSGYHQQSTLCMPNYAALR